jgi:hypothetical protein
MYYQALANIGNWGRCQPSRYAVAARLLIMNTETETDPEP